MFVYVIAIIELQGQILMGQISYFQKINRCDFQ